MAFLGQEQQIREYQERFRYLYGIVFLGLGLLLSRLIFLQVLRGDENRQFSEQNHLKRVKVEAPRGMIFDRDHRLLIDNRPAFDLEVTPQYFNEAKQKTQVIKLISKLIKLPEAQILEALDKAKTQPKFMPVKIKTDLTREEVAQIESWRIAMPGVEVREEIKRTNIYGEIGAHLLGYIGEVSPVELPRLNKKAFRYRLGDVVGKFGLEQRLEETLRGIAGEEIHEVDALGRVKLDGTRNRTTNRIEGKPAIPGKNLVLTIDQDLQLAATEAMGDRIGAVVAIDPRNGQILAMISRPSFDPTEFSRGIPTALWTKLLNNENHPLSDKTIQDHYAPGSTFKVVTAIAALQEKVIDSNTRFRCTGSMRIGNRVVHCAKRGGHGEIDVVSALTQSCNIFFLKTAQKLKSVDDIAKWAFHLGFGKRTGINLAREVPGNIPTEEWKRKRFNQPWNPGETASVAIGQSFVLTTGLQLANSYAALANGGTLFRPTIVKSIEDADGKILEDFTPEAVDRMQLDPKTVQLVKQGLWGVVNAPQGTGYSQRLPGMDFAGKTGSVQVLRISADKIYGDCHKMRLQDRHNALFVGFAPAKDPVIAVSVIAEHGCHGASGAAPVARAVVKRYLEKYYPEIYGEKILAERLKKEGQSLKVSRVPLKEEAEEGVTVSEDTVLSPQTTSAPPPAPPRLQEMPPATQTNSAPEAPDDGAALDEEEDE